VEKGEGEVGDGCCALDVQEFVCRRALVFTMGPSRSFGFRDKALLQERTGNILASVWSASLASDQIGPRRGWGSTSLSFLAAIMEQRA